MGLVAARAVAAPADRSPSSPSRQARVAERPGLVPIIFRGVFSAHVRPPGFPGVLSGPLGALPRYRCRVAVTALVVAIVAVVVSVFAAVYARTQALAAKGSLAIEQERHQAELAQRFDAEITGGSDPVLRLRLLPGQLPLRGVWVIIVQGRGVGFDESRRPGDGGEIGSRTMAAQTGVILPGSTMVWPLWLDRAGHSAEVGVEIWDEARLARITAVTVAVPPGPEARPLEA